jgi:hypothetical protein
MPAYDKPLSSGVNNGGISDLGNGLMLYCGTGAFSTTDETDIIDHPFGKGDIFFAAVVPLPGSSIDAQDQPLGFEVGATANLLARDTTYGTLKSVTSGKAQIRRAASGSSGLAYAVQMIGRARH